MAYKLLDLELDELSLVDVPANQFADVLLVKRGAPAITTVATKPETVAEMIKRHEEEDRRLARMFEGNYTDDGEPMNTDDEISKAISTDLAKGRVTVLKSDVEKLAKSRADSLWRARGCPKDGKLDAINEAWDSPLDEWSAQSAENPTLGAIYASAPASSETRKAQADITAERDAVNGEMDALIAKVAQEHPGWSRLKVIDAAYRTPRGQTLYTKYVALGRKLERTQ